MNNVIDEGTCQKEMTQFDVTWATGGYFWKKDWCRILLSKSQLGILLTRKSYMLKLQQNVKEEICIFLYFKCKIQRLIGLINAN